MTDAQIIAENDRRKKILFCDYNPATGIGSQIERFPLHVYHDKPAIHLPLQLKDKYGSIKCLEDEGDNFEDTFLEFIRDRLQFDFEFWAWWCIKIKPKGESGGLVPFKLNWPQRFMLAELIKMLFDDVPVRVILVKARQWGGSTLVQMFMMWIQTMHKTFWNSAIVADVEGQALGVRAMYEKAVEKYRPGVQNLSFKTYQGNSDWKIIPERDCVISIGSMQRPSKIRQQDISMAHCTEVALWTQSENKTPKDLIQTLQGTILDVPYSCFVLESTAKGTGNYFHDTWVSAENGDNSYKPVFLSWFRIEMYTREFKSKEERAALIGSMSEYELFLWKIGATLEGIKWYRMKSKAVDDEWSMKEEFPSTAEEAFVFSGRPAFNPLYVENLKLDVRPPIFTGDIFPAGVQGDEAKKDIRINEVPNGPLKIWAMPNDPPVPKGKIFKNRYGLFVDIGGASKDADYSVISVFDRYYIPQGGMPEAVATWMGHLDQDLLAWKAMQMAILYENGYLAFETNTYDQKKKVDTEGDHSYIILDKIANYYDNLYTRTTPEQIKNGIAIRWGFHTNHQSRGMLIDGFRGAMRDSAYVEYDKRVYDQAKWFVIKDNGKMEHADGKKDDLLITRMGGYWLVTSEDSGMGKPEIVDADRGRVILRKPIVKTAAKF